MIQVQLGRWLAYRNNSVNGPVGLKDGASVVKLIMSLCMHLNSALNASDVWHQQRLHQ